MREEIGYSTPTGQIERFLENRHQLLEAALCRFPSLAPVLAEVVTRLYTALGTGNKVLAAGNGGSAAEAQHFVAELVGRFKRERIPYPAIALTADTAILTAVANDYGYQHVFERQVRAYGQAGDLLIVFSTSGESENLIRAVETARRFELTTVAITSDRKSRLESASDITVRVPVVDTAITQELHMLVTHLLCEIVEERLAAAESGGSQHAKSSLS